MKQHTLIDWDDVRKRIRDSERALQATLCPDDNALRNVLEHRARALAHRRNEGEATTSRLSLLAFLLGADRFAVELKYVAEVGPLKRYTLMPGGPPELAGVFAHRGEARSVLDLAVILGRSASADLNTSYFIHLRWAGSDLRIRVDGLDQVLQLSKADVLKSDSGNAGLPADFLSGFTRDGVIVLQVEALLTRASMSSTHVERHSPIPIGKSPSVQKNNSRTVEAPSQAQEPPRMENKS